MSVRIVRESVAGVRALFAKTFELFTGGFGWAARATDDHAEGITLPAGSLLTVDEESRTAFPVKRGRTTTNTATSATGVNVEKGHLFEVGDDIHFLGNTGTGATITAINVGDDSDYLSTNPTEISQGSNEPAGEAVFAGTAGVMVGTANAIAAYPTTIEEGASVAALRRGTVYGNRIPPIGTHDTLPDVIEISDSQ